MRAKVSLSPSSWLSPSWSGIYIRFKPASPESPVAQQTAVAPVDNTAPASAGASPILKRVAQGRSQEDQLPTRSFQFATDPIEVKAQLTDLGMSGDPANLKVILSQLENPNQRFARRPFLHH